MARYCKICDKNFADKSTYSVHLKTEKHKLKEALHPDLSQIFLAEETEVMRGRPATKSRPQNIDDQSIFSHAMSTKSASSEPVQSLHDTDYFEGKKKSRPSSCPVDSYTSDLVTTKTMGAEKLEMELPLMVEMYLKSGLQHLEHHMSYFLKSSFRIRDDVRKHCDVMKAEVMAYLSPEEQAFRLVEEYMRGNYLEFMTRMKQIDIPEDLSSEETPNFDDFFVFSSDQLKSLIEEHEAKATYLKYTLKKREVTLKMKVLQAITDYKYDDEKMKLLKRDFSQTLDF